MKGFILPKAMDDNEKANFESMLKVREYKDKQTKSKR
jgi:hypothetical protein